MTIQLFYPLEVLITSDMHFEFVEPKSQMRDRNNHFRSIVVLDLLKEPVALEGRGTKSKADKVKARKKTILSERYLWNMLDITENSVQEMRLVDDNDTFRQRVIITYFTPAEAKAAVLKYHRTPEYRNICAVLASDLIDKVAEMEKKIKASAYTKSTFQIVTVAKGKYYYHKEFKRILADMLSFVSSYFHISVVTEENCTSVREAHVLFPSLTEALSAEFAFDGTFVDSDKDRLQVKVGRHLAFVQHDLQCRVSCILPPEQEGKKRLQKKFTYVKDLSKFPEVGCVNYDCEGCGNKFLKPPK